MGEIARLESIVQKRCRAVKDWFYMFEEGICQTLLGIVLRYSVYCEIHALVHRARPSRQKHCKQCAGIHHGLVGG